MEKIFRINLIYSFLIILAGIYGFLARYFEQGDWQYTSLIPAAFGLVLLSLTGGMKKHNRIISHIVVMLTLILAVMVAVMMVINLGAGRGMDRKILIFAVVLAGSLTALGFYVASFIAARRNRES